MNSEKKTATILEDVKINIKIKLSVLWVAVMFLFLYVDYFTLYVPGVIEDAIAGKMGPFPTTQVALLAAITLMTIPSLMVFLSLTLKPRANRWTNIIVGILFIVVQLSSLFVGESWAYYIFASIVEVVLLSLIVVYAWKWPKQEVSP
jgi:hypothetical protein